MTDMRHLDYLKPVADADVTCLLEKERTYKGSWKSQGGKNAWAMVRRKIDRLMVMLGEPTPPPSFNLENVNDTIRSYVEGTLLPGTQAATAEMFIYLRDMLTAGDIFAKIEEDRSGNDGSVLAEIRDLRRYLMLVEAEIIARHAPQRVVVKELDPKWPMKGNGKDPDESHHSSEFPWRISRVEYEKIYARAPNEAASFWTKQAPDIWTADAFVETKNLPRELNGYYQEVASGWRVIIDKVPDHVRYIFPSLYNERNMMERNELPAWQHGLYQWDESQNKYSLQNRAWHVDNA